MTSDDRPARTPAGDAFSLLVIRIFQLNGRLGAAGDALAKPAGQSTARWQVLASVQGQPRTVADIARALELARQSVQRTADLLADEGLAVYEDNPGHRRAKLLRLTPAGETTLAAIQAEQRVWADRRGAKVGKADLERAAAILDRVSTALGARRPG